ncbi:NADP-dependent oxidoreductase [Kineosporia sp. NBRC 101731]|uniref:NADP-dependent oxidoreductase n=1 Tax=Kineosporia sp. NBRC 101731 TaxID=3032199 RepID=UPI0024A5E521|nr:NADP-dependent oxidoreductase [Kineosporia sp. NBRC 101731]GLY29518.1 quinone oxidoreductase [Kineosporia sp. NBRC 101731]
MKALVATGYGPPEQLSIAELPVPQPGPGQVLVKVAASSLNPTDAIVVRGGFRELVELEFPYVPGNDFAGRVVELGAGVTRFAVGDEIFGLSMPRQLNFVADDNRPSLSTGGLAEYAVVEADTPLLALRPASVPAEQAAALGVVGSTALGLMKLGEIKPGHRVLVIGATGGVGTAVIPLLAAARAQIVATSSTEAGAQILRELGAGEVIGHAPEGYPSDVDVVFNLALYPADLPSAARVLKPGGRFVSIIFPEPTPELLGREDVSLRYYLDPDGRFGTMDDVARAAEKGELSARIAHRFTLDEAVTAVVTYVREKNVGKIVVTM